MTEHLRSLMAAATPGEWFVNYTRVFAGDYLLAEHVRTQDADLICAAVNALPALLKVVDAARDLQVGCVLELPPFNYTTTGQPHDGCACNGCTLRRALADLDSLEVGT